MASLSILRLIRPISTLRSTIFTWKRPFSVNKGKYFHENLHLLNMPAIMEAKEGVVDKWLKKEGDSFEADETLCEISLDGFQIAVNHPEPGILAEIIVGNGKTAEVEHPIATFAPNNEVYLSFLENRRIAIHDEELEAEVTEVQEESNRKPDKTVLMREVKHLIKSGTVKEGSDFAKKLQSLARKGNEELLSIFIASFEGSSFNNDSFDSEYFLENAKDIIEELEEKEGKH